MLGFVFSDRLIEPSVLSAACPRWRHESEQFAGMRGRFDIIPARCGPMATAWRRHESGIAIRNSLIVPRETIYKTSYVPAGISGALRES
ncbi:MAG: hypothetical protein ABSA67_05715 [Candidatus Brocadiia bacterium]|jgi:hypothetical protein